MKIDLLGRQAAERRGSAAGARAPCRRLRPAPRAAAGAPARAPRADLLGDVVGRAGCRPSATPILGLATKSTAPSSSARSVTSAPRSVSVETITTGIGRRRISSRQEVEAVHARHLDVERDHVGVERCGSSRARPAGRRPRRRTAMSVWRLMISVEQAAHQRRVVDHHDADLGSSVHRVLPSDQNRSTEPPPAAAGAALRPRRALAPAARRCSPAPAA